MSICACILHVWVYVYLSMHVYVYVYVYLHVYLYVHMHVCAHINLSACLHACVDVCGWAHGWMCVYMRMYVYIYTYMYIHVCVCSGMHMGAFVCTYCRCERNGSPRTCSSTIFSLIVDVRGMGHLLSSFFGVHTLRMTTTSSSTLKVGFAVAEEANA